MRLHKSNLKYLTALKTILEINRVKGEKDKNDKQYQLEIKPSLFNCTSFLYLKTFHFTIIKKILDTYLINL